MAYTDRKISLEECAGMLPADERESLRSFLAKTGTSPRWYATNSFNVRYRGGIVYRFRIFESGSWVINLTLAKPADLDETLMTLPGEERCFYFNNLRRCKRCNPAHGDGKRFVILGDEYWGCAEPEIEMENPAAADVDMLSRFVEIRKRNISLYK